MKLIIDIDEELKQKIDEGFTNQVITNKLWDATKNGTPLEQEPSGDAISRQAVLEQTYLWSKDEFLRVTNPFDYLRKRINSLPSAKQEPKTGHWINITNKCGTVIAVRCSNCKNSPKHAIKSDFCPNCGARMVELKGRSDKE